MKFLISSVLLLVATVPFIDLQSSTLFNSKVAPMATLLAVVLLIVSLIRIFRNNAGKASVSNHRPSGYIDSSGFDVGGDL